MEAKAADLLAAFKNPNVSIDARVTHLTSIKSDIKQKNVPEGAILTIFDTLKLAISSQHYSVCAAGFSTLGHFLKRLTIQDQQQWILAQTRNFYPVLMERLGDHKERVRTFSATIFTELWPLVSNEVEYFVLEVGMKGKNPRARESSLLWLSNMTRHHGLLFRQYVPSLVGCLEDADSAVRDTAKGVVVELFRNAPARAKSDIQKQLVTRGVRKSIANAILTGIGLSAADPEPSSSARPISRAERPISVMSSRSRKAVDLNDDEPERPVSRPGSSRSHHDRPVEAPARPKTPAELPPANNATPDGDGLEPFLISSARDIDDLARDMLPWFEGKESEDNWMKREKNVILFRRLTLGNAPHDFTQSYIHAAKSLLDGFFKVVNSLRTTLSTSGCLLIQDMARVCGPKIDSMVEIMMQNLLKLCSALKKIAAQNGNTTVDAVIANVTFSIRLLQHIHWASQDKNVQVRLFAAGWLQTLINRQSHHKSTVEHGGGLDLVEKSIKKGLGDANPGVREATRSTFWTFFSVWPDRAEIISSSLDPKSRNLLERDPANPNVATKTTTPSKAAPRSALKEAIAARKRAQAPSRPDSAQSFAETRSSEPAPKPATRTVPTGAPLSSLSSAPVRPSVKPRRPEISRPATADPYARRPDSRAATSSKQTSSPRSVRSKASTPSSKPINAPRLRPHESAQTGTTRGKPKRLDLSKSKSHGDLNVASRSRSGSNEGPVNPSLKISGTSQSSAFEEDAPAPIVLESPPLSASHPSQISHTQAEPHQTANPDPVPEPELMSLEDPAAGALSPERERQVSTPPRNVDAVAPESDSRSQADEMVIYEDPATPVAATADFPQIEPVENLTPTPSPRRHRQETIDDAANIPVESTTPIKPAVTDMSPRRELAPDGSNEPFFETPLRRTPLRGSPSPSRNRPLGTPSENGAKEPSLPEPAEDNLQKSPNNENATAHISKPVEYSTTPRSAVKTGALEEVPLNESALRSVEPRTPGEEPRRTRKWAERHRSPSPRSKDPANAKEMLHKALSRIASKNIDISGYRKLQGLFQYHGLEIVAQDEDYYAVLEALLKELESAPTSRKDHDVKTQILATVRSMLLRTGELFHQFDIPAMAAIIRARRHYESSSHFVTCLEEVADLLSSLVPIPTSIDGVLQGMEFEDSGNEESARSIIMGFSTINHVLSQNSAEISDEVLASVGSALSQHLGHPRPGVRKQATELCTLLNLKFGLDRVQKVTPSAGEGSLNLLTYFMARRSQ